MIKSLSIKNIATFLQDGIVISDLKKISFIYGANGSGKTTISNYIQEPENSSFYDCSLKWENDIPLTTITYNKKFREQNFGKGSLDGVFTLGQATKEEIEAVEKKRISLKELKEKGIKKKETSDKQKQTNQELGNSFKENVWLRIYKKYENNFKEAFVGYLNKEKFKTKLLQEYSNGIPENIPSLDILKKRAKTLFGNIPVVLQLLPLTKYEQITIIESDKIWGKKIIGKSDIEIAKLIQNLNINDWVSEGQKYIQEHNDICPFCQQKTITPDFRKQIEEYFDETFKADIATIKSFSEEYVRLFENVINQLTQVENTEKENKNSKIDIDLFSAKLKTLLSQFSTNKERILKKIKEPSRSLELLSTNDQLSELQELIDIANKEINKHNKIVANYSTEKSKLIQEIWDYIIGEHKLVIEEFVKKNKGLLKGIALLDTQLKTLREQYQTLKDEIKEANKNITSVQPTVDAINDTLNAYGFQNFKIVPSTVEDNQYQIQREDGAIAETTLSEGEITFITFLYFLQLVKGSKSSENILEERVIIVDDPISSLDSNVLFVVSSLIKEIIKTIKKDTGSIRQIILLTHNVYFHKEVSFIDGRTTENNETNFWILRKIDNKTSIQCYEKNNPIQNSYELLWQELKNQENNKSNLTIQNIMRRIIENYFKILGKYGDDDLIKKFENPQEKEICRSLISWINDGSHSIPDDIFIEQQESITEKYFDVFKRIFKEMEQIEHYNMMMR
jgi:wobble nucleotide-excising tRNase